MKPEARKLAKLILAPGATHYEVLGMCPGDSSFLSLKHRRLYLASLFHPDRCDDARAGELMARVNAAYSLLTDEAARRLYEVQLLSTHYKCSACEGHGVKSKQKGFAAVALIPCSACNNKGWLPKGDR